MADAYALQILFVYFLTLPSLLHLSILLFFILVSVLFFIALSLFINAILYGLLIQLSVRACVQSLSHALQGG